MDNRTQLPTALARMAGWSVRRWTTVCIAAALAVGGLTGSVVFMLTGPGRRALAAGTGFTVGAVVGAGGSFLVYLVLRQIALQDRTAALVNIRPLSRRLPVDPGGWAADPTFADELVRLLCRRRPDRIVECGSGWTTVFMAVCLEELGSGQLKALEHLEHYARITRELVERSGGSERAEVLLAPLGTHSVSGQTYPWYDEDVVGGIEGPIDVLVVDGPPTTVGAEARFPAVPIFRDRLAEDAVVLLDDGFRADEARIASRWGRLLGVEPHLLGRGRGVWILDRRQDPAGRHREDRDFAKR